MKQKYTLSEIRNEISILKNTFDVVRIVDPDVCRVVTDDILNSNTAVVLNPPTIELPKPCGIEGYCFNVWSKESRCSNCISARCLHDKSFYTKFENIKNDLFMIISKYISIDGQDYAIEMVKDVTHNFILSEDELYKTILDMKDKNRKLITDTLTSIYNRRYIDEHFINSFSSMISYGYNVNIAILDIDDFKIINDTYGHECGDRILRTITGIWKNKFENYPNSFIARYGGDEFLIVHEKDTYSYFINMIKDIFNVSTECNVDDYSDDKVNISVSIGCASVNEINSGSFSELFNIADHRLYKAKAEGKSLIYFE